MDTLFAHELTNRATPPTMKAMQISAFGDYEQMILSDVGVPAPQKDQVLVRVAAAGVGPWDGWILAGKSALPQPLPLTLGADFAGEVMALGDGAAGVSVGERIYGVVNGRFTGAWADARNRQIPRTRVLPVASTRSRVSRIAAPLTSTMTSPFCRPKSAAGVFGGDVGHDHAFASRRTRRRRARVRRAPPARGSSPPRLARASGSSAARRRAASFPARPRVSAARRALALAQTDSEATPPIGLTPRRKSTPRRVLDRLPVDLQDDVAALQSRLRRRRSAVRDAGDQPRRPAGRARANRRCLWSRSAIWRRDRAA